MPIIDRKTVTFHTTAIEGVDTIKYVDALFQDTWAPFEEAWEAYWYDAYFEGVRVTDNLTEHTLDKVWSIVNEHQ